MENQTTKPDVSEEPRPPGLPLTREDRMHAFKGMVALGISIREANDICRLSHLDKVRALLDLRDGRVCTCGVVHAMSRSAESSSLGRKLF